MQEHITQNTQNEFSFLKQYIDFDDQHKLRLDDKNNFCRYSDIRTYRDNKVPIQSEHGYINASWIHMPLDHYFIATQGPLESTIEDFWEMCYAYDVKVIIMLCKLKENDREKCANYWEANLEKYRIEKIKEENVDDGLTYRILRVNNIKNNTFKIFYQIQLLTWDDHEAPISNYSKIIKIIYFTDQYRNNRPVVVHCSAGVGRTGSFISMYNLYHEIIEQILNQYIKQIRFSVMNTVRKLKEMRLYLVENQKQYSLLYEFVDKLLLTNNRKPSLF